MLGVVEIGSALPIRCALPYLHLDREAQTLSLGVVEIASDRELLGTKLSTSEGPGTKISTSGGRVGPLCKRGFERGPVDWFGNIVVHTSLNTLFPVPVHRHRSDSHYRHCGVELRQYLYLCTSKASKLSTCGVELRQYLYLCASKASKLSTCGVERPAASDRAGGLPSVHQRHVAIH